MNKKLADKLDRISNSSMRQIAFQIRTASDYQQAVDYYRKKMKELSPNTLGHEMAFEALQRLPLLMKGYKEKFILQTF